jgi:DNA-binding CsgD family transcriptional regulator
VSVSTLEKLEIISQLQLPAAAAVPDVLGIVDQAIPGAGSLLLWSSRNGMVAGAYSSLTDLESGIAHYAQQYANSTKERQVGGSTFREDMDGKFGAETLSDILEISYSEFQKTEAYRFMLAPWGIADLARIVVPANKTPIGGLVVFRGEPDPPFTTLELDWLSEAAPRIGTILSGDSPDSAPVIASGPPGMGVWSSQSGLDQSTAIFRQHCTMLNQNAPGQDATTFSTNLPPALALTVEDKSAEPRYQLIDNAWGQFRIHIQPISQPDRIALISERCIPFSLKIFRELQHRPISRRQLQVACGLAGGMSFADMARLWDISRHSIITHVGNLYAKLGVDSKTELMDCFLWGPADPYGSFADS